MGSFRLSQKRTRIIAKRAFGILLVVALSALPVSDDSAVAKPFRVGSLASVDMLTFALDKAKAAEVGSVR